MSNTMIDLETTAAEAHAYVVDLADVDGRMLAKVGGKAGNLGEMIRAGLPVPGGFCVTTAAYSAAVESVPVNVIDNGAHMRESVSSVSMPPTIAAEIATAYESLGRNTPVAVRSSATAEDLPHASFAGQQDTYLNVIGERAVLDAVQRCWVSLWTDRAVVYRTTHGIDQRAVRLAVVVQQMVDARIAGVLFTANPVTGQRRQTVIDANPGLGEAVVSGAVNPDHFVVDTGGGWILERRLGDKRFEVVGLAGGGTERVNTGAGSDRACITDDQARALTLLGAKVEAYFQAPQDIEWAIDVAGKLWLTQARPITTLYPLPIRKAASPDPRVYFCFSLAQGLNRPITPMGLAGIRVIASAGARILGIPVPDPLEGPPVYAEAGQRVFVDVTSTLRGRVGRILLPMVLDAMEARSAAILRRVLEDPRLTVTRRSRLPFVKRVLRLAVRFGIPLQIAQALISPKAARARIDGLARRLEERLALPECATSIQRLAFVEEILGMDLAPLVPLTMPAAGAGFLMLALAGRILGPKANSEDLQTILRGLPHNVTTEMDLELWKLAQAIRRDEAVGRWMREIPAADLAIRCREGSLPDAVQRGLKIFLTKYGHRGVAEIDIGVPRWSDDPTYILGVLTNYLRLEDEQKAPDAVFRRSVADAEAMARDLSTRVGTIRGRVLRFAFGRVRELAGIREIGKYLLIVAFAAIRRELSTIGEELASAGRIDNREDVFFLDLKEVRAALGGCNVHRIVGARREEHESEMRRRHVPRVLLSDGCEPEPATAASSDPSALTGTPASAGSVTGIARVVLDPVGARIDPGEILVAPSTDPGWTPLFLTAGALVMEMGGANSHGAVVAREYGIPAVVGVADATKRIKNGDRITVDGATGTIRMVG